MEGLKPFYPYQFAVAVKVVRGVIRLNFTFKTGTRENQVRNLVVLDGVEQGVKISQRELHGLTSF